MTRHPIVRSLAVGTAVVLSSLGAVASLTATPASAIAGVNRIAVEGELGDTLMGGRFSEAADPTQINYQGARIETGIDEFQYSLLSQNFDILFQADRDGEKVTAGLHEGAVIATDTGGRTRKPQGVPGLNYFGAGVGCFTIKGRYRVDEVTRDAQSHVTSFAARFEQHCAGADAASFGTVAFNSTVPLYVHQLSALSLTFPSTATGSTSAVQPVTITNRSTVALPVSAITLTGLNANQFTIVSDPCSGTSIPLAGTCTVNVALKPTAVNANLIAKLTIADSFTAWGTAPVGEDVRLTGAATAADAGGGTGGGGDPGSLGGGGLGGGGGVVVTNPPSGGEFHALEPARILDTRDGTGTGSVPHTLGDAETITVAVAGHGGVPLTGATAVAVNLTATAPKQPGWLSLFPSGTTWPGSSTVNFPTDGTAPNMAIMALGTDGKLSLRNCCGSAEAIIDVVGWYGSPSDPPAAGYNPLTPQRLLDTRDANQPIGPDTSRKVQVRGQLGVPADATSVVMNVTATAPTAATYVTVYPSDVVLPKASSLNVVVGETRPNLVSVKLSADGAVNVYNHAGSTHIVLDVVGYYGPSRGASGRVAATAPARLLDTRTVTGGALGAGAVKTVDFRGDDGQVHVAAAIINVTVTDPTSDSFVTVFPNSPTVPGVSNLNFVAGQTIANLVIVPVGADGKVAFFNHLGSAQLVVDLVGVVPL